MGRIIAIDYGQKRAGLAVTDELQIIATALTTVPAGDTIAFLKEYASKNAVECFVVGEARQMNNRDSESAKFIEPFVRRLREEFPAIPIERIDERFTSLMATRAIRESGAKKKARQDKSLVDTVSAVIILQSFMEKRTIGPGFHRPEVS
ncbi:MAG: Holliday junction resolvase RuvX [Bacteroidetes bacterium]|nr:Holliday junction resolvase RuvX [Bacteroidota bacterium]